MSNVRGRIAVDVQFTDSTSSEGVQSLKTITLQDATEHTTGKVAIVTGTCGIDVVYAVLNGLTDYKDAIGQDVTFSTLSRCAVRCTGSPVIVYDNNSQLFCSSGAVSVFQPVNNLISCNTTAGTASFTMVIYGS